MIPSIVVQLLVLLLIIAACLFTSGLLWLLDFSFEVQPLSFVESTKLISLYLLVCLNADKNVKGFQVKIVVVYD